MQQRSRSALVCVPLAAALGRQCSFERESTSISHRLRELNDLESPGSHELPRRGRRLNSSRRHWRAKAPASGTQQESRTSKGEKMPRREERLFVCSPFHSRLSPLSKAGGPALAWLAGPTLLVRLSQIGGIGCHWRELWPASVFVWRPSGIGTGGPKRPPVAPRDIHNFEVDGPLRLATRRGLKGMPAVGRRTGSRTAASLAGGRQRRLFAARWVRRRGTGGGRRRPRPLTG